MEAQHSVAEILFSHGQQLLEQRYYDQAKSTLYRCLNLLDIHDSLRPKVLYALAQVDEADGDYEEAARKLEQALDTQLVMGDERLFLSRLWEQLARVRYVMHDYDAAMDACFEALKLRPDGSSLQLLQQISIEKHV